MGTRTLTEMRAEVIIGLLDRDDVDVNNSDATGKARLNLWINQALRHITSPAVYEHRELQANAAVTLTTGGSTDDQYVLSSLLTRFWAVRWVRYPNKNRTLRPARLEDLDNMSKPAGAPTRWAMEAQTLVIDTQPGTAETDASDTLTVRFWQRAADLTSSNTTTTIPDVWDHVIVQGAVFYGWLALGQAERADFARESFAALINEVGERENLEAEGEGHAIVPTLAGYQAT